MECNIGVENEKFVKFFIEVVFFDDRLVGGRDNIWYLFGSLFNRLFF